MFTLSPIHNILRRPLFFGKGLAGIGSREKRDRFAGLQISLLDWFATRANQTIRCALELLWQAIDIHLAP
jgi:hypothetical protein